jgi:hypothetical protein
MTDRAIASQDLPGSETVRENPGEPAKGPRSFHGSPAFLGKGFCQLQTYGVRENWFPSFGLI